MSLSPRRTLLLCLSIFLSTLLSGCAQFDSDRGVEVNWSAQTLASFKKGVTSRADVMAALGPPSQLVSLGDETVLYYLNESTRGTGLILLVYNRYDLQARYDRAVFIFDSEDRLSDYAGWITPDDEG
jgi:outer membrane protein assembly factor BamE (lipoprotein component of BamABCDE complex)